MVVGCGQSSGLVPSGLLVRDHRRPDVGGVLTSRHRCGPDAGGWRRGQAV